MKMPVFTLRAVGSHERHVSKEVTCAHLSFQCSFCCWRTVWKSRAFRSMGWIDWLGYRAQGSTDPLPPRVSDHGESPQERTERTELVGRGRKPGLRPCPTVGFFHPSRHLQGSRKDAERLKIHQIPGPLEN